MIDEQMKAPLPPPPARRARRGTRASQGGVSGQTESNRPQESAQESGATLEAPSKDQTREAETSTSRSIEPEEGREQGLSQAEPKPNEPPQEPSSPEQTSAGEKSATQDQPQGQVAESVARDESPSDKPSSQEDPSQVQEQETAPESQAMSGDNREIPEALAQNHDPVPEQATGEDQDSSSRVAEQAAPPSAKSELPEEANTDTAHGDVGDFDQKDLAKDEPATESSESKSGELSSGEAQEHSQSGSGDVSIATPSHSQDQALKGTSSSSGNAGHGTDLPAPNDHQEASSREDTGSPDQSTASEYKTTDKPAREEEPDQSRSQPTTDGPTASDSPSEHGGTKGSDNDDLFHGVAKGGAAEEYVKMAEAESGQEPQLEGGRSSIPEQNSSSGSGQSREQQDEDPSRGIEEPESAQLGSSTTERESPEHTSHAQTDERRLSASGTTDSVEDKARSPVESERESSQLQSRDIGSLDHGASHDEPTVNPDQQLQNSSEQPELDQSQDLGSSPTGDSRHEKPSSFSQDSPDVGSSNGEPQEPGLADHSQNEHAPTEPSFQPRNLDLAQDPEPEDNKASTHETSVSEKDAAVGQPAEDQQEPHGNEQRDLPLESEHGERGQSEHDAVSGLESGSTGQQGPSGSDPSAPGASSHDSQLEKELGSNQDTGSNGGHEQAIESHDAPQTSLGESVSGDTETPRQSSHDTPNIVEPSNTEALSHESASEQEPGDKRSDSGYETGMASSRNLEDSTNTLHEDQHEHQHAQEAEQSLAGAPSESEQEKPRQPRPEQILEGSGKGASPPRLGGEHQGSDDRPAEETFDLSGSEPIPGTMTHGKDETEGQAKGIPGGDVSSQDVGHQQAAEDAAVGVAAGDNQRGEVVDETREKKDLEDSFPHESSQKADHDQTHPESQFMAHDTDNTIPADARSQAAEEQLQQGEPQSVTESPSQGPSGKTESSSKPSTDVDPQDHGAKSNDDQAEQAHPEEDVKNTTSRDTDEPQPNTLVEDGGAGGSASRDQISEASHVSQSPTSAHDIGSDRFGSWGHQAFSGPADNTEFSFKKRADSVQVGRSHGPTDRGADLPSITTDGPNEDADEGLFAVPPTPRHEVDHDKPSQLQSDSESKPSSRASSRNGSTGADSLSPKAAEGLQGSYREDSDRELPQEASAPKEDVHHEISHDSDGQQQARPDVIETSGSPEEKTAEPSVDSEGPLNRGTPERGQPEEPSVTGTESLPRETSAGDNDEQKGQRHSPNSPTSPEEQSIADERQLDEPLQPGTSSLEQHTGNTPSKPDFKENYNEETQTGSDKLSRGTSLERDSEPAGLTQEHGLDQEGSSSSHTGGQALESSGDVDQQEGPQEDFSPREMSTQPNSERIERDSGESDNRSLGENGPVQHGKIPEPQPLEDGPAQNVSPEDKEISGGQDSSRQIADPPQISQGETQHPESGPEPGDKLEQGHAGTDRITHQPPPDHSNQHLGAQQVNYDGEGYGVTPSSEYSNDPLADSAPRETNETHPADDAIDTRQHEKHAYDLTDSTRSTRNDDPMSSGSETFETPLESADFRRSHQDSRSVTPGHFTQALDHLPDESAHTVQGTDDLFDDTDDAEDQDDYGEAVVYQYSNEAAESSPGEEKTVFSTRGDENNTALGGHRSSLSLGSVGHRSQGSMSSLRDTTPVRPTFGSYIGGPSIVRADWAAEHEEELRPSSVNPTPQLGPSTTHDTPEISPFALRNTPMPSHGSDQRGLSSSMWNPERPQTPPSATSHSNNPFATPQRQAEPDIDPSLFVPRDVTHGRQDSVPASLHSQTTLDSSWSSPVHSSLPVDRHEPVIRDSWPAPAPGYQQYLSSWGSRPRGDTTSTAAEYDPFKPDNGGAPGGHHAAKSSSSYNPFLQRGRAESSVSATPSNPSASNSPSRGSALFAKMRNIFESQSATGANDVPASPGRTRPVSGVFHPAASAPRKSQDSLTGQRGDERGGFLNEADHEIDERSAFLRSDGQPSGHMAYNDEH